jgi:exosortase/archaeosortase family protein
MIRFRPRLDRPLDQLRFLAALLVMAPALLAGYALPRSLRGPAGELYSGLFSGYLRLHAHLGAAIVRPIDPAARAVGSEIRGCASVMIGSGYDAIDVILPFTAAVLVFPARLRHRAIGIALGVLSLSALNMIRVASLYGLASHGAATVAPSVAAILRVLMVTLAMVGFIAWGRWVSDEAPPPA